MEQSYEKLKELTRGQTIDQTSLAEFINKLPLDAETKNKLLGLTPASYIGNAKQQAKSIVDSARKQ